MKSRSVLVLEDEETLRNAMVRGLRKLADVDAQGVGSVREARAHVTQAPPDLLISDLDLPDGSGLEVVAEIQRAGLRVPVVFVSAFLGKYRHRLPRGSDFEVYEKPVSLDTLRNLVEAKLQPQLDQGTSPFGVADYIQLAGMSRHSVVIDVRAKANRGKIIVRSGDLWSATDEFGQGLDAFRRLTFLAVPWVSCYSLVEAAPDRNLDGSTSSILIDAARLADEAERDAKRARVGKSSDGNVNPLAAKAVDTNAVDADWDWSSVADSRANLTPAPAAELKTRAPSATATAVAQPTATPPPETFDLAYERGVEALLRKDYSVALSAFRQADQISPGDRRVSANLSRLAALGVT